MAASTYLMSYPLTNGGTATTATAASPGSSASGRRLINAVASEPRRASVSSGYGR